MFKNIIKAAVLLVVALFFIGLALGGPANARAFITGADIENGSIMYKDLNHKDVDMRLRKMYRSREVLPSEQQLVNRVAELEKKLAQLEAGQ